MSAKLKWGRVTDFTLNFKGVLDYNHQADLMSCLEGTADIFWRDRGSASLRYGRIIERSLVGIGEVRYPFSGRNWQNAEAIAAVQTRKYEMPSINWLFWKEGSNLYRGEIVGDSFKTVKIIDSNFQSTQFACMNGPQYNELRLYYNPDGTDKLIHALMRDDQIVSTLVVVEKGWRADVFATRCVGSRLIWRDSGDTELRTCPTDIDGTLFQNNIECVDENCVADLLVPIDWYFYNEYFWDIAWQDSLAGPNVRNRPPLPEGTEAFGTKVRATEQ